MVVQYIDPTIGPASMSHLDRDQVAAWINELDERGLSGKTIKNVHGLLSGACKTAIRDRLRSDNPCHGLRLPTAERRPPVFLTPEEVRRIVDAMDDRY
jgi:site-specific recombinase XerD